jgi:hypothetical protein
VYDTRRASWPAHPLDGRNCSALARTAPPNTTPHCAQMAFSILKVQRCLQFAARRNARDVAAPPVPTCRDPKAAAVQNRFFKGGSPVAHRMTRRAYCSAGCTRGDRVHGWHRGLQEPVRSRLVWSGDSVLQRIMRHLRRWGVRRPSGRTMAVLHGKGGKRLPAATRKELRTTKRLGPTGTAPLARQSDSTGHAGYLRFVLRGKAASLLRATSCVGANHVHVGASPVGICVAELHTVLSPNWNARLERKRACMLQQCVPTVR